MDRNQATGLILIALLLLVYFNFLAPEPTEAPAPTETSETQTALPEQNTVSDPIPAQEEIPDSLYQQQLGLLAAGASGTAQNVVLENDEIKVDFSTKGATFKKVELKDYQTYEKTPLILLDEESSNVSLELTLGPKTVDLYEPYYSVRRFSIGDTSAVEFKLPISQGREVVHTYKLGPSGYQVMYELELRGLTNEIGGTEAVLTWVNKMKKTEKDVKESRMKASVNFFTTTDGFEELSARSTDNEEENIQEAIKWVTFKQLFFNAAIIADKNFDRGKVSSIVNEADTLHDKYGSATLAIGVDDLKAGAFKSRFFFGPNKYNQLKKVATGFEDNVYLGYIVVNWVNKYLIIPIFNLLERYIGNYGVIIIILVLIIKLILFPLSYKSYVSMAKTRVLKPELDELKTQYPDDMQKQQQEQMKLYQQVGVNPLSGCIPVVLQMPILFAMFFFFPNSIELRQEAFLWADDLSTYDSVLDLPFTIPMYGDHVSLFTLLMTLSTILYTWSTNSQNTSVQGPMKSITYMMPVIFMFVLNSFPAGLSFYYFVTNIISFGQQMIIRRFVDDDKIHAILQENRKKNKNKKKSKFQAKLEEAMKAKDQNKNQKKK